jgi:hypothetical protein
LALQALGREVLHASAIRTPRGVVVLCAVSETGKSTIAYGLSRLGYTLWADDAVAFEAVGDRALAVPIPFQIRLRPASLAHFGRDPMPANPPSGWESAVQSAPAPLAAVCLLERAHDLCAGATVDIRPLAPIQALPMVLAHAYCFSLRDKERTRCMFQQYLGLVRSAPVFGVRFEAGLDKLPAILGHIEQHIIRIPSATYS